MMQARIHHPRNEAGEQPRFLHISWLYTQDYCEYQLYLDQVEGVAVDDTPAMVEGSAEHQRLEDGLTNAEIGRTLGIHFGHEGHEGHISRSLLSLMETEGAVYQDGPRGKWFTLKTA